MFSHFFHPKTQAKIYVTASLTLLTLSCLFDVATSDGLSSEDCEALINDAYNRDKVKIGTATFFGAVYLGPIAALPGLLSLALRSKNQIAQDLTNQGICSEYINHHYQIERQTWGLR